MQCLRSISANPQTQGRTADDSLGQVMDDRELDAATDVEARVFAAEGEDGHPMHVVRDRLGAIRRVRSREVEPSPASSWGRLELLEQMKERERARRAGRCGSSRRIDEGLARRRSRLTRTVARHAEQSQRAR